jgi:tetratricopeptide (TPR) repeat protein
LGYLGNFSESEEELDAGIRLHGNSLGGQWWQGTSWLLRAQNALLRHDVPRALEAVKTAKDLKNIDYPGVGKVERDIIEVEWVLGAALLLEGADLNSSYTHLSEALTRCRRINLTESEPDILLAWARWYRARGNHSEAKGYAEEALAIADRYEYRLKQAEIHNFMAEWWFEEVDRRRESKDQRSTGDLPKLAEAIQHAAQHAEIAKERASCDGAPHCYKLALEDADAMLQRISKERA